MAELLLRIGFSLIVVMGLLWCLAKVARRPLHRRGGSGPLTVLSRQALSRTSSVAVVRVLDRALVLGITEHQISLLGETDLAAVAHADGHVERRDPVRLAEDAAPAPVPVTALQGSLLSPG